MPRTVELDIARGLMIAGQATYPIADAHSEQAGCVRLGGAEGPLLRPLLFGERNRIAQAAAGRARAVEALAETVLAAACAQPVDTLDSPCIMPARVLALSLAGAGVQAPAFSASLLECARRTGWLPQHIEQSQAIYVDTLLARARESAENGWQRIVFPPAKEGADWEDICRELALNLIARVDSGPSPWGGGASTAHASVPLAPATGAVADSLPAGDAAAAAEGQAEQSRRTAQSGVKTGVQRARVLDADTAGSRRMVDFPIAGAPQGAQTARNGGKESGGAAKILRTNVRARTSGGSATESGAAAGVPPSHPAHNAQSGAPLQRQTARAGTAHGIQAGSPRDRTSATGAAAPANGRSLPAGLQGGNAVPGSTARHGGSGGEERYNAHSARAPVFSESPPEAAGYAAELNVPGAYMHVSGAGYAAQSARHAATGAEYPRAATAQRAMIQQPPAEAFGIPGLVPEDIAEALAAMLNEEANLRGID